MFPESAELWNNFKHVEIAFSIDNVGARFEYERYGAARDARVEAAGIKLIRTGSPYAVAPGRVRKPSDDTPYRVYTPFYRAWCVHGWRAPAKTPQKISAPVPPDKYRAFPDFVLPATQMPALPLFVVIHPVLPLWSRNATRA